MTVLVVLGAWLLLSAVVGALFAGLVRGGGGTDLPLIEPVADLQLPAQRESQDGRQRVST